MELNKNEVKEVLLRLFRIFKENNISCSIFDREGWRGINIEKDFNVILESVEKNNPDIYKNYNSTDYFIEMAEAYCRGDSLERFFKYMYLSLNEKEEERYKIREFKNYINLYENYNYLFTKNKNLEIFYNYCKNYVIKNDKIQELYIKFKEKKLNIPEQSLKLDLKKLNEYIRENGRVTIYSKITDFNYITVIPKNLWKYYYLSEITREPLFFYNLKNDLFEKIEDLFIEN